MMTGDVSAGRRVARRAAIYMRVDGVSAVTIDVVSTTECVVAADDEPADGCCGRRDERTECARVSWSLNKATVNGCVTTRHHSRSRMNRPRRQCRATRAILLELGITLGLAAGHAVTHTSKWLLEFAGDAATATRTHARTTQLRSFRWPWAWRRRSAPPQRAAADAVYAFVAAANSAAATVVERSRKGL